MILRMRRVRAMVLAWAASAVLVTGAANAAGAETVSWKQVAGDHFLVYYLQDEGFAKEVSSMAERYYQRIASELGYPRYSAFWTWDNRVKIYIFPDHASFLRATGQPEWSQGLAEYSTKRIFSYAWSEGFTESLLPHEIAHLIFRDFIGFKGQVPLWLDEGVSQWAEEPKRRAVKEVMRRFLSEGKLLSLSAMMKLDVRELPAGKGHEELIDVFYVQSVSLVGFLIERYGSLSFAEFCRGLRDGKGVEEALRAAYPDHVRSLDEFEKEWRGYIAGEM